MSVFEPREQQEQQRVEQHLAKIRHLHKVQNAHIRAQLDCPIPDVAAGDCKACGNEQCITAWCDLQALWPEIGDWPPQQQRGTT